MPTFRSVITCTLSFMWSVSTRAAFVATVPAIAAELHLSTMAASLLLVFLNGGYVLGVALGGRLAWAPVRVIIAGEALTAAALLALLWANNFPLVALLTLILSVGCGMYLPKGLATVSQLSTVASRGRHMAIHELGAAGGFALGALVTGLLLPGFGWRLALLIWGAGLAAVAAATITTVAWPHGDGAGTAATGRAPGLDWKGILGFAGVASVFVGFHFGFMGILPLLMVREWQLEVHVAATQIGVFRTLAVIGPLLAGLALRRTGRYGLMAGLLAADAVLMLAMMPFAYGLPWSALMAAVMLSGNAIPVAFFSALTEAYPGQADRAIGVTMSLAQAAGMMGAPPVLGAVLDRWSPPAVFLTMAVFWLFGALLAYRIRPRPTMTYHQFEGREAQ